MSDEMRGLIVAVGYVSAFCYVVGMTLIDVLK